MINLDNAKIVFTDLSGTDTTVEAKDIKSLQYSKSTGGRMSSGYGSIWNTAGSTISAFEIGHEIKIYFQTSEDSAYVLKFHGTVKSKTISHDGKSHKQYINFTFVDYVLNKLKEAEADKSYSTATDVGAIIKDLVDTYTSGIDTTNVSTSTGTSRQMSIKKRSVLSVAQELIKTTDYTLFTTPLNELYLIPRASVNSNQSLAERDINGATVTTSLEDIKNDITIFFGATAYWARKYYSQDDSSGTLAVSSTSRYNQKITVTAGGNGDAGYLRTLILKVSANPNAEDLKVRIQHAAPDGSLIDESNYDIDVFSATIPADLAAAGNDIIVRVHNVATDIDPAHTSWPQKYIDTDFFVIVESSGTTGITLYADATNTDLYCIATGQGAAYYHAEDATSIGDFGRRYWRLYKDWSSQAEVDGLLARYKNANKQISLTHTTDKWFNIGIGEKASITLSDSGVSSSEVFYLSERIVSSGAGNTLSVRDKYSQYRYIAEGAQKTAAIIQDHEERITKIEQAINVDSGISAAPAPAATAAATLHENIANRVYFTDDFFYVTGDISPTDLDLWETTGSGGIEGNKAVQEQGGIIAITSSSDDASGYSGLRGYMYVSATKNLTAVIRAKYSGLGNAPRRLYILIGNYYFYFGEGESNYWQVSADGGQNFITTSKAVDTAWHTFKIIATSSQVDFYIDDELVHSETANIDTRAAPILLGAYNNSDGFTETLYLDYIWFEQDR